MSLNINKSPKVNTGVTSDVIPVKCNVGINSLPVDVLKVIFTNDPADIDKCIDRRQVCKLWNKTIQDMILRNELPMQGLSIFGTDAWEKFGFTIEGEVPRIPRKINQIAKSLYQELPGEEDTALSFSAILMPKGLTLNKIKELMEKKGLCLRLTEMERFFIGNSRVKKLNDQIVREFGDRSIKKPYWYLMTNGCVEGTRSLKYIEQVKILCLKSEFQCLPPTALEAISCCVMNKLKDGKHFLFRWNTYCEEKVNFYDDNWRHLIIHSPQKEKLLYLKIDNTLSTKGMAACLKL